MSRDVPGPRHAITASAFSVRSAIRPEPRAPKCKRRATYVSLWGTRAERRIGTPGPCPQMSDVAEPAAGAASCWRGWAKWASTLEGGQVWQL